MICFRCEDARARARVLNARRGPWQRHLAAPPPADHLSLRNWILHALVHAELHWALVSIGFLDAEHDGGLVFWRWDCWNAHMARRLRLEARWRRRP